MIDLIRRSEEDKMICDKLEPFLPDEFAARGCSYHIQQAIEKQLKAYLLAFGVVYPHTHNSQRLLNEIKENNIQIDEELANEIEDLSDTLNAWEATTRYEADHSFTERKYIRAKALYNNLKTVLSPFVEMYRSQTDDAVIDDEIIPEPPSSGRK